MDYLITGGNGFIGHNLCNRLDADGCSYKIVDITGDADYCIDVTVKLPLLRGDTIVHLASETNVRKSIEYPRYTINRNTAGLLNCIDLVQRGLFRQLIFVSSASSKMASSPYLASKLSCEAICYAYISSFGLDIKVLKLSNVYGPYATRKESVIAKFIKNTLDNVPLIIYGDGSQARDFIYVEDVVDCIIDGRCGYITSGKLTSIKVLAEKIKSIANVLIGYEPRIVYEPAIKGEVIIPKIRSDIFTKYVLDKSLVSTFKWFKEHYGSKQLEYSGS
jgi:UDP-glucose 4-epimerase